MRVLFVTHYSGYYGANKSLLKLITILQTAFGVSPVVLLPNEGQMTVELLKVGVPYCVHPYYWWVNYNHGAFQWLLNKWKQVRNLNRAKQIVRLLENESFDLVYSNSICINMGCLLAKKMRIPHIWQARESLTQFSLSLSRPLSHALWASKVNRRYILISNYMVNYYRQFLPADRMVKVYNGVSLPPGVSRQKANELHDRLQIALVGVLCEQKNQLELLQAQALLHKDGVDVETWLIGTAKTEYLNLLQDYIKGNDLTELAHIVGHSDDVFGLLQDMNLGVVTAKDEAFGRVTVEYMLMQMPVVVCNSGANAELVESGVTGEIYELGNIEALGRLIKKYFEQPDLLKSQGKKAEQKAKKEFSAEQNADLIYAQIKDVLN